MGVLFVSYLVVAVVYAKFVGRFPGVLESFTLAIPVLVVYPFVEMLISALKPARAASNAAELDDGGADATPSPALLSELEKRYATMGAGELQALLATSKDLRPGAADLIRAELARRQAERRD